MALRGAVDAACNVRGRHRNPSLLSIPHYLKLKFQYPPSHALHRFTAFPIYQPGGLKYPIRAISEAIVDPLTPKKEDEEQSPQNWTIKMLYDGDCPLCMREVMGRIHAILSDGTIITDVEAFRRLYEQVGLGWVYAITKYEPIATITDSIYGV